MIDSKMVKKEGSKKNREKKVKRSRKKIRGTLGYRRTQD